MVQPFRVSSFTLSQFCALCAFTVSHTVHAHQVREHTADEQPSCSSVWVDPDGDGYGWDTIGHGKSPHSCLVTTESAPKPLYVKDENGDLSDIDLIRPYWDANADLAGKEIECAIVSWNTTENAFKTYATLTVEHSYMRDEAPWVGSYNGVLKAQPRGGGSELFNYHIGYDYRIVDGSYFASSTKLFEPVSEFEYFSPPLNQWLELITNGGRQGVRLRGGPLRGGDDAVINGDRYMDCFDKSGSPFKPTGSPNTPGTSSGFSSNDDAMIVNSDVTTEKPEIVNAETRQPVELKKAVWNLVTDVFDKTIDCWSESWTGGSWHMNVDVNPILYLVLPPEPGGAENTGLYYSETPYYGHSKAEWSIVNNSVLIPPLQSQWYEEIGQSTANKGVRYWGDDGEYRTTCYGLIPTGNSGTDDNGTGYCDYTNAASFDGFGWNPVTRQSCPPAENQTNSSTENDDIRTDADADADADATSGTNDTGVNNDTTQNSNSGSTQNSATQNGTAQSQSGGGTLEPALLFILTLITACRRYRRY